MLLAPTWLTVVAPSLALIGGGLSWGLFNPRSQMMGRVLYRGPRVDDGDPPRVALTFDDGPTPDSTPAVLDALSAVDAPAAFFVIGRNADRHPHLLRQIDEQGHLVGNHTFDHDRQGLWHGGRFWRRQIDLTDDVIFDIIGKRPALFRPPMGFKHWHLMAEARFGGHQVVNWSRRAIDGGKRPRKHRIIKRMARAGDGDILLLHDGHEPDLDRSRTATADAVRPIVNQLRDRGIEIVRLDELLGLPAYQTPLENVSAPIAPY